MVEISAADVVLSVSPKQVSKKLELGGTSEISRELLKVTKFLEMRSMRAHLMPHEFVRHFTNSVTEFYPEGDDSWLLRRGRDLQTDLLSALLRTHGETKIEEAEAVVRLACIETWRRFSLADEDGETYEKTKKLAQVLKQREGFYEIPVSMRMVPEFALSYFEKGKEVGQPGEVELLRNSSLRYEASTIWPCLFLSKPIEQTELPKF